jgi:hypothetical protein
MRSWRVTHVLDQKLLNVVVPRGEVHFEYTQSLSMRSRKATHVLNQKLLSEADPIRHFGRDHSFEGPRIDCLHLPSLRRTDDTT